MATVLVVEDNPMNLELVKDLLETEGHVVLSATNAEDGVRLAYQERPDLILMDIRLPGMDGHEAVRQLKSNERTQPIPTIALTAQAMKGDMTAALSAGFDGYIAKPLDTRAFRRQIRELLGQAEAQ